ncbi:MAG: GHKL domain-containing protein [Lachnospiraceae bacterium]|nr:GHKL domain-containing protein [Lachnospiraceae bacterium]
METLLLIFSSILDIFILKTFLTHALCKPKTALASHLFHISIVLVEVILIVNMQLLSQLTSESYILGIINSSISIITTIFLCCFMTKKITKIISLSVIFQIMVLLSERFCLIISYFMYSNEITDEYSYMITMNLMSKLFLLLFVLFYNIITKKTYRDYPTVYNLLLLIAPVLSLLMLIIMPLSKDYIYTNLSFFVAVWIFMTLLNIIYLTLTEKLAESYNSKILSEELQRQLNYQKEKYIQLGESYKTCRRLIHDIKHHNEMLRKYIEDEKYDYLYNYLSDFTTDLEKTYARFNTGNLVIDALFSNYNDLLKTEGVDFITNLVIDITRIPVSDYDLSILIGNLLDNSYKATKECVESKKFVSVTMSTSRKNQFTIIIENTYNTETNTLPQKEDLQHGYGINNVKGVVEQYHGIIEINTSNTYKTTIIIPIIEIEKRTTPHFRNNY